MSRPVVAASELDEDREWKAVYGGSTTCPDGSPHRAEVKRDDSISCIRCDALLAPLYVSPVLRWRFLEINSNHPRGRFLAVQIENQKPPYDPDWRCYEEAAKADGLFEQPVNSTGNRHGEWHEGDQP